MSLENKFPYVIGDKIVTKIIAGRHTGRWIPAYVMKVHSNRRTVDLCVHNNHIYQVSKYAVQVPISLIKRPKFQFKVGDRIFTKILRGRKEGVWIPARVIRVNDDGSYDICVDQYKSLQVTKYAVHVPEQYLRPARDGLPDPSTLRKSNVNYIVSPQNVPVFNLDQQLNLTNKWEMNNQLGNSSDKTDLYYSDRASVTQLMYRNSESKLIISPNRSMFEKKLPTEHWLSSASPMIKSTNKLTSLRDAKLLSAFASSPNILCGKYDKKGFTKSCQDSRVELPYAALGFERKNSITDEICETEQSEIENFEADSTIGHHRNRSNLSDWDEFFASGDESSCKEIAENDGSDVSVISDAEEWGFLRPPRKELTPSLQPHSYQSSNLTSPARSERAYSVLDNRQLKPHFPRVMNEHSRKSYEFVDSFIPKAKRKRQISSNKRIVTIGVSKHRIQFSEMGMDTPLEQVASWLAEGYSGTGKYSNGENLVHNIAFKDRIIPIRSKFGGSISDRPCKDHRHTFSLGDVLGKSVDASSHGLAFFVGPVQGQMSYKMSVLDAEQINRARTESECCEIKEDVEIEDGVRGSIRNIPSISDTASNRYKKDFMETSVIQKSEKMDDVELLPTIRIGRA